MNLHERLQARTRELHEELERQLPIAGPQPSVGDYEDHLRFMLSFLEPLERRLSTVQGLEAVVPDLAQRRKSQLLHSDLGELRERTVDTEVESYLPPIPSRAAALGVLYVTEGATLGGRVVLERLQALPLDNSPVGFAFLEGYGAETGPKWRRLLAALEELDEGEAQQAIQAARATFQGLIDWLQQRRTLP